MNSYVGLSVVYLSGLQCSDSQQFGTYSQDDVDALRAIAEDPGIVDLFLTYPFFVTSQILHFREKRSYIFCSAWTVFVIFLTDHY